MNNRQVAVSAVLALLFVAAPVLAIEIGDPAPELKIKEWVKGDPVDLKAGQGQNIYIVEFWATWCGPCIKGIPHMTEMQHKYKDKGVVFVGVSDEKSKLVQEFVKKQGDKMDYTVAVDDKSATSDRYMKAFKKNGIPQCFVVDKKGNIVWEGHPMFGLEEVIQKILTEEYDVKTLKKIGDEVAEKEMAKLKKKYDLVVKYLELVSESDDAEAARALAKELYASIRDDSEMLNEVAWKVLTDENVKTRDLKFARMAAKQANDLTEGENAAILDTYARALWDSDKKQEAIKVQQRAVKFAAEGPMRDDVEKTLKKYEEELSGE